MGCNEPNAAAAPIYRPLGNNANSALVGLQNDNGALNQFAPLNMKQQQQQHSQHKQNLNTNSSNVLIKTEPASASNSTQQHLLHSPLAAATAVPAANAANTPHDLQAAAAAYIAAAFKAATAGSLSGDDLLLQQQLQQNDQIEITRLPSAAAPSLSNAANLAQLLDASASMPAHHQHHQLPQQQQNSKCKQQKCPFCPYISESKSQMNYHISLHKPTQYECPLCTFVCAKKQHLSGHMRSVHQQQPQSSSNHQQQQQLLPQSAALAGMNMDFSVALKLAAAAQAQQVNTAIFINPISFKNEAPHTF